MRVEGDKGRWTVREGGRVTSEASAEARPSWLAGQLGQVPQTRTSEIRHSEGVADGQANEADEMASPLRRGWLVTHATGCCV